ncbi:lipoprotein [Azoarcus sp. DD4]|uniref:LPS translocon maturation chaperone LptM n=1 Tax=Azoarcus sp. DD4 TaxID=2027405 RepID=UPI001F0EB367|nr:lipoprotein [Azoarcus sp. DD4]
MLPAVALSGALLLSGCGIKGPLYLPDPAKTRPVTSTRTQPQSQPTTGADHSKTDTSSPTQ